MLHLMVACSRLSLFGSFAVVGGGVADIDVAAGCNVGVVVYGVVHVFFLLLLHAFVLLVLVLLELVLIVLVFGVGADYVVDVVAGCCCVVC